MIKNIFYYENEIGVIRIADNGTAITELYFDDNTKPTNIGLKETELIKEALRQLSEYFAGHRKSFSLPAEPIGTPFQMKVWSALQQIPYGETRSYKEIAQAIGQEKACRAVGMANNKNPIAIIIPCHRVIGSNGKLIGYAGGLNIKERLLDIESKNK